MISVLVAFVYKKQLQVNVFSVANGVLVNGSSSYSVIVWVRVVLKRTVVGIFSVKMTSAQVVETSVTNNGSSQNYPQPDDHSIRINY